jgi:hypothetical protein
MASELEHAKAMAAELYAAVMAATDGKPTLDTLCAKEADFTHREFLFSCAANPRLLPHMRCWMVDVCGKSEKEHSQEELQSIWKHLQDDPAGAKPAVKAFVDESGGSLLASVAAVFHYLGLSIPDKGAGSGGWTIGAHCTQGEADMLCRVLETRFRSALAAGLIRLRRVPWSLKFED